MYTPKAIQAIDINGRGLFSIATRYAKMINSLDQAFSFGIDKG